METATEQVTALATIEQLTPIQLFAPGALNPILERIKAEVRAIETDISTPDGRKAIGSLCYKIARTKTFIDGQRKELVADEKKRLKAIDEEGARVWDELDALRDEVRKPLTEWEDAEKKRTAECERRINLMAQLANVIFSDLPHVEAGLSLLDRTFDHGFAEFTPRAVKAHDAARVHISNEERRLSKEIAEAAERERLRLEAEEKARIEREAKIAEQARLKAEAEAKRREEAAALAAKQREEEQIRVAAQEKARLEKQIEDQRLAAERDRLAAIERERKIEADRLAAIKKAEDDRVAAEKKAEADRIAAVEAERKRNEQIRLAEEQKRDALAREKATREADKAHRATVNSNAVKSLIAAGLTDDMAKIVVTVIARGQVPNVSINY